MTCRSFAASRVFHIFRLGALLALAARPASAADNGDLPAQSTTAGHSFTAVLENDLFFNTDRYYTNGVSFAFTTVHPILSDRMWNRISHLLELGRDPAVRDDSGVGYGVELAQMMATPRSILIAEPQPDDRPWAGLLYLAPSLTLQAGNRLYIFKVMLGVTGPWSLADRSQAEVHRVRDFALPQGWDNQIPNEVVGDLAVEQRRRFRLIETDYDFAAQLIGSAGYKVGTIEDSIRVGAEVRAGFRLPDDFGSTTIGSAGNIPGAWKGANSGWLHRLGAHLFAGASGSAVAYQVMLDGTVFHDSPHIGREPFVARFTWGGALTSDRLRLSVQGVLTTREFKGQPDVHRFSSISLSFYW